jgi:hypothetical protein
MKLFLDDIRDPSQCAAYMYTRIGKENPIYVEGGWYVVRNYAQFVKALDEHIDKITHISFDHDLADGHYDLSMDKGEDAYINHLKTIKERTGYDCALFTRDLYKERKKQLPIMFVHSMNPVGMERIIRVFKK